MTYDSAAWGAFAFAISILLGVVTFFRWRSRGLVAGLEGAGWTLLPIGLWMTGVLKLVFNIASDVGDWAVHLVFSPTVWLGICVTGISAALAGAGAVLRRRRNADAPSSRSSSRSSSRAPLPEVTAGRKSRGAPAVDDLDDIEAILRKHGIS
jgi:hypothetical protein